MGLNKAILIGNVGRKPELKTMDSGVKMVKFTLATSDRRRKDDDGKPYTEWHNVVAWGKLAEIITQYVDVGMVLYIEGRIQTRSWDGEDGNKKYFTEIVADQMEMLSRPAGGDHPAPKPPINEDDENPF